MRRERHAHADACALTGRGVDHQVALEDADPLSHADQAETGMLSVGDRIEADTRVGDLQLHVIPFAGELD